MTSLSDFIAETDAAAVPELAFHPLADLFPLIEGEAFAELVADIAAHGQRDPIVLHGGRILDGRNRFRACRAAGIAPRFSIFGLDGATDAIIAAALAGRALTDEEMRRTPIDLGDLEPDFTVSGVPGGDALGFVISKNLRRRHLDESQRALVAARLANLNHGGDRRSERLDQAANLPVEISQSAAGDMLAVSERSVRAARTVLHDGAPELIAAVERGEVAVSVAEIVARMPLDEQKAVVAAADKRAIGAAAKKLRDEKTAEKKARRTEREAELGARQKALPAKRYGVIYADPEWKFLSWSPETGMDRAADNHYPTSETNDIVLRPVGTIAAEDCVLFLWATAPMLKAALRVMEGWGFDYKTHFVWAKDRAGTGYWNRNRHELLLVGVKGGPPAPAMGTQWDSLIAAPLGAHSEKPDAFAELIETTFPNLPKIELNARRARPGWDVWGFEAPEEGA